MGWSSSTEGGFAAGFAAGSVTVEGEKESETIEKR